MLWDAVGNCVIVDPGCYWPEEFARLREFIAAEGLTPKAVWLTHGHFDHVHGVLKVVGEYSVPVLMSPDDKIVLDNNQAAVRDFGLLAPDSSQIQTVDISDGEVLDTLQGAPFKVITTPGHTPGCVCYYGETGDVFIETLEKRLVILALSRNPAAVSLSCLIREDHSAESAVEELVLIEFASSKRSSRHGDVSPQLQSRSRPAGTLFPHSWQKRTRSFSISLQRKEVLQRSSEKPSTGLSSPVLSSNASSSATVIFR